MEGPSLKLAEEQLRPFRKQAILRVSGNTKIGKERLADQTVRDIFSWGKHLVFQFDEFALRIHFLLFGTFAAEVEGRSVTGDYKKTKMPRLLLEFPNGRIEIYNASLKFEENTKLKKSYDFTRDILARQWDAGQALEKVRKQPEEEIADILLDQEIFAGLGNIIKNEVLSLLKIHPERKARTLKGEKLRALIAEAREFSRQFYRWRKRFQLRKHLKIYQKGACPHCERKVTRRKTGKRERMSYFCERCQN